MRPEEGDPPDPAKLKIILDRLTRELIDNGRLIEAGWISLKLYSMPPNAPAIQVTEMRNAFFAGAQHLFSSIMRSMDPEAEPTPKDLDRLSMIHLELEGFIEEFKKKHSVR